MLRKHKKNRETRKESAGLSVFFCEAASESQ